MCNEAKACQSSIVQGIKSTFSASANNSETGDSMGVVDVVNEDTSRQRVDVSAIFKMC